MRAGLPQKEPELLARWASSDLYQRLREAAPGRPKFILHDGPPYANGNIHIGHALNKILKDMVTRSQQMLGLRLQLRARLGLPRPADRMEDRGGVSRQGQEQGLSVPRSIEFRSECRAYAEHWLNVQREEFKRLGVEGDWDESLHHHELRRRGADRPRDHEVRANGTLYRGSKPVMWSVVEKTALAEAEVEYEDYTSDRCG